LGVQYGDPRLVSTVGVNVLASIALLLTTLPGCMVGTHLAKDTPTGGTVVYSFTDETDILASGARHEALRLMNDKCPMGYRVQTEGELAKVRKNIDQLWSGQMSMNRVWGVAFICK
jgi:hypothetical protein